MTRQIISNKENFHPERYLKLRRFIDSPWFQSNLLINISSAIAAKYSANVFQKALEECFKSQNLSNYAETFINELILVLDFSSDRFNPVFKVYDAENFIAYLENHSPQHFQNLAISINYNKSKISDYLDAKKPQKSGEDFISRPCELYKKNPLYQHIFLRHTEKDTFKAQVNFAAIGDINRDRNSIFLVIKNQNYFILNNSKIFNLNFLLLDKNNNTIFHYLSFYPEFDINSIYSFNSKLGISDLTDSNSPQTIHRHGNFVNYQNIYGQTALFVAASHPNGLKMVKFLKSAEVQIETRDSSGKTALMAAIEKGHYDIVEFLIQEKARYDICDIDGNNILDLAIKSKNIELLNFIINQFYKNLYENPKIYHQALIASITSNSPKAINLIYEKINSQIPTKHSSKITLKRTFQEVLLHAVMINSIDFIIPLLEIINNITESQSTQYAKSYNKGPMALFDIDDQGETLIHKAIKESKPQILEKIHAFFCEKRPSEVEQLLKIIDEQPNIKGLTPFSYAVINLDIEMVKILINKYSANPFKVALFEEEFKVVAYFALEQFNEFTTDESNQFNKILSLLKKHYELLELFKNNPNSNDDYRNLDNKKTLIEKISKLTKNIIQNADISTLKALLEYAKSIKINDKILIEDLPILEYLITSDQFDIILQAKDIFSDNKEIIDKFLQPKTNFIAKYCSCFLSKHPIISHEMSEALKIISAKSEPILVASIQLHQEKGETNSKKFGFR